MLRIKFPIINKSFTYLLSGQFVTGMGDMIFLLLVPIILVDYYNADARMLLLFTIVETVPQMLAFLVGPYIDRIQRKVRFMVILEALQLVCALAFTLIFYYKLSIYYLLLLGLFFSLINELAGPNVYTLLPRIIPRNMRKDAVRISVIMGNSLDIGARLLSSIILASFSIISLLYFNVLTFVISTLLFTRITIIPVIKAHHAHIAEQDSHLSTAAAIATDEPETEEPEIEDETLIESEDPRGIRVLVREYVDELHDGWKHFISVKTPAFLIAADGILNSVLIVFNSIFPLYISGLGINLRFFGTIILIRMFASMFGALLTKYLKFHYVYIFIIDYTLSIVNFAVLLFVPNLWIKAFFYMLNWMFIGASGSVYDYMIYSSYNERYLARINTLTGSLLSVVTPIAAFIALYINDIQMILWANMLMPAFFVILCIGGLRYLLRNSTSTHNVSETE